MATARRTTLNDLAESLGLSANTVSRALTGKDGVSPRTRERVQREAELSGYIVRPERPSGASRTVALVVTSATNVFISALISSIESACRAADYSVVLHVTEESSQQEQAAITAVREAGHAGAIVIPVHGDDGSWVDADLQVPVVAVSREISGLECDFVGIGARDAMYAATKHLLASGGRSLLLIDEDLENVTIADRATGFRDAVRECPDATGTAVQLPTRRFESSTVPWQPDEAFRRCLEIFEDGAAFDAIAVSDDYYALGVLSALKECGLLVPDDVLLIGYGNHPYSGYLTPTLSTVDLRTVLIGEIAVSMLQQRITGDTAPARHRLVKSELVIRESSLPRRRRSGRT